jgi:hypothetical protein
MNKEGKILYEFMYILLKFNSTVYMKENSLFINLLHMLALDKRFDLKSAFLLYEIDRGMILMKNLDGKTPMNVSTVSVCMYVFMYVCIHISISIYVYMCICVYVPMYMNVYVFTYIYIHMYILQVYI